MTSESQNKRALTAINYTHKILEENFGERTPLKISKHVSCF